MKKLLIVLIFFSTFSYTHAQTAIGTVSLDGVDIEMTPANPAPGDSVTVDVKSYSKDLNGANINWLVNGKSVQHGTGITNITVSAPAIGKNVQVMADVIPVGGGEIQKVINVQSGSVDLITETSGYTPPLYRGKNTYSQQNTLSLIAIPHLVDTNGKPIDQKNIIYTWKQNSTVLGDLSGYGKQNLKLKGSLIARPFLVDVKVTSSDGKAHAEKQIAVSADQPSITFYQNDPLYGVEYNKAVGDTVNLAHNQLKITAVPFGFDVVADAKALVYSWMINNIAHDELASSSNIILATPSGASGSSNISLTLQNNTDILQSASADFTALFNSSVSTGSNSSVSF